MKVKRQNYFLKLQGWARENKPIRVGEYSTMLYRLAIEEDDGVLLVSSPYLPNGAIPVTVEHIKDKDKVKMLLEDFEGAKSVPTNTFLNQTKATPSELISLDSGQVVAVESSEDEILLDFYNGSYLEGKYRLKKEEETDVWRLESFHFELEFKVLKRDEEKRLVYGVALVPNKVDLQGDIVEPEEIEKAAHDYLRYSRNVDLMHSVNTKAYVVESYIAPEDLTIDSKRVVKGSWVIVVYVDDDDVWNSIKKGELRGFSIFGLADRIAVGEENEKE